MLEPWELLEVLPGWSGYLPIETHRMRLPDGSEALWDIFGGERSVAVLALTGRGDVVLARQFRPGPGCLLDEMPGGYVEEGEDVIDAARRELLEETGFGGDLELAGRSWLAAGAKTERFVVVARNARKVADARNEQGEFCDVVLRPMTEFREQLRAGELTDVDLGYLALDHLSLLDRSA